MESTELEMERMEVIRQVVETDSRELLQQLKEVVDAWRGKREDVDLSTDSEQKQMPVLKEKY